MGLKERALEVLKQYFGRVFGTFTEELDQAVGSVDSLLDVGCGPSSPIRFLSKRPARVIGYDGFKPSVDASRSVRIHDEYVVDDLVNLRRHFAPRSVDCVIAIDVIEHFQKNDGLSFMSAMESVASKKVIIITPNGFQPQAEHSGNSYQRHLSGWEVTEMLGLGYSVSGLTGLKFLRGEYAQPTIRPAFLGNLMSRISQPLVRRNPRFAYHILCVKNV